MTLRYRALREPNAWVIFRYDYVVASLTFSGVRFSVYSNDHLPHHVHGTVESTRVIVDLLPSGDVRLSQRVKAIRPGNAKYNLILKVLNVAAEHSEELRALWEKVHGTT